MTVKTLLCAASAAAILASTGASVALAGDKSAPYFKWTGPLPENCPLQEDVVFDKYGNTYSSPCFAALVGVRITYK